MVGSDSHTPAAGAIGMLAIGSGGMDVALAMAGEPLAIKKPEVWGVKLTGELPDWCSAKDVILEMLRRHDVDGAVNRVIEYYGPGLDNLSVMDRHVMANMGTELGATSTVFPSDDMVKQFFERQERPDDWRELRADDDADYDHYEEIDLSEIVPLVAKPTSPGNVVPVREIEGKPIYQSYVGSSANPGYRDFAIVSKIMEGRQAHDRVSLDVNPTSRQVLQNLTRDGHLLNLIQAGARIHQAGCNGCIGMGQAPAKNEISLRTVPRNFPDRSGTEEDMVHLVSPETAAASALTGKITDPRDLEDEFGMSYPGEEAREPDEIIINEEMLVEPPSAEEAEDLELEKGPNITKVPAFDPAPSEFDCEVLLKMGDDISTDEILRAGAEVLPYRSNIEEISKFTLDVVDDTYHDRALRQRSYGGHALVAGTNYGQGSSREHAALAPRYLGLRFAIAKSYARIHWQNLANFGVLPLEFLSDADYEAIDQGDELKIENMRQQIQDGHEVEVINTTKDETFTTEHTLSDRQVEMVLEGGLINIMKKKLSD
jgi:aconitate hydratase